MNKLKKITIFIYFRNSTIRFFFFGVIMKTLKCSVFFFYKKTDFPMGYLSIQTLLVTMCNAYYSCTIRLHRTFIFSNKKKNNFLAVLCMSRNKLNELELPLRYTTLTIKWRKEKKKKGKRMSYHVVFISFGVRKQIISISIWITLIFNYSLKKFLDFDFGQTMYDCGVASLRSLVNKH